METKTCRCCGLTKPIEQMKKKGGGRRDNICKACDSEKTIIRQAKHKAWYIRLMGGVRCAVCGEDRHYVLEWHHANASEKESEVSKMVGRCAARQKILAEIEKCIPLCRNCHAEVHYKEDEGTLIRTIVRSLLSIRPVEA